MCGADLSSSCWEGRRVMNKMATDKASKQPLLPRLLVVLLVLLVLPVYISCTRTQNALAASAT